MLLQPHDKAPDFIAPDHDGHMHSLEGYRGKKIALYFYPKDNTETCTKEACNLRDNFGLLKQKGIVILGVSADDAKSHKKFASKYSFLSHCLWIRKKGSSMITACGPKKKFMGRTYMGILRTTFLINEEGYIDHVIEKVESKTHAAQIMQVWGL